MRKNIVVTGGAGFIGSHLVDELIKRENNVFILDNLRYGLLENINLKAEFIRFDVMGDWRELSELFKRYQIDEVYHLVAEPYIPECYEFPEIFLDVNVIGVMNVLLACKKSGVKKILHYSSSEVYGSCEGKISEKTPINPQSTYAVSKLAGDRLCFTFFKEHNIPVVILRQFNMYGPRGSHKYVIPEIISQLLKSNQIRLGNIKAERDFLYVEDGVKMAIEIMEKGEIGETYNLGSGGYISIEKIANLIAGIMGKKIEIKTDKRRLRPFDVQRLWCDNNKIYEIIKQRPENSLKEGLVKTIGWFYKNNYRWPYEQKSKTSPENN